MGLVRTLWCPVRGVGWERRVVGRHKGREAGVGRVFVREVRELVS